VGPPGPNLSKGPQLLCDATGHEGKPQTHSGKVRDVQRISDFSQ